ncbi:hypothetical protein KCU92_g8131, partial [Aureobasidium melanogenum]
MPKQEDKELNKARRQLKYYQTKLARIKDETKKTQEVGSLLDKKTAKFQTRLNYLLGRDSWKNHPLLHKALGPLVKLRCFEALQKQLDERLNESQSVFPPGHPVYILFEAARVSLQKAIRIHGKFAERVEELTKSYEKAGMMMSMSERMDWYLEPRGNKMAEDVADLYLHDIPNIFGR